MTSTIEPATHQNGRKDGPTDAWYGSAAGVVNSTWGHTVLPVFPIARR